MKSREKLLLIFAGITGLVLLIQTLAYREKADFVWDKEFYHLPGAAIVVFAEKSPIAENLTSPVEKEIAEGDLLISKADVPQQYQNAAHPLFLSGNSMFQIQYLPQKNSYLTSPWKSVNGVAFGYFLPQKEINGVSVAMLHMYNEKKNGFSMSLIDASGKSNGFSLFFAGGTLANNGFSMGVLNVTESNNGVQVGLFNQAEKDAVLNYPLKPVNEEKKFGVQAGVINYSDSPGIQFGLWNTNPNSLIKHFPLINICW